MKGLHFKSLRFQTATLFALIHANNVAVLILKCVRIHISYATWLDASLLCFKHSIDELLSDNVENEEQLLSWSSNVKLLPRRDVFVGFSCPSKILP